MAMSHHTWNYQDELRKAGYRVTPQRETIMDVVCEADRRLSAVELCEAVRTRSPGVNPATVYRNLHFLAERKLLRAVEIEGHACYELAGPEASHHHLVCRVCGRETEIPEAATEALYRQIEADHGFRVEEDHLVLAGVCANCREGRRAL